MKKLIVTILILWGLCGLVYGDTWVDIKNPPPSPTTPVVIYPTGTWLYMQASAATDQNIVDNIDHPSTCIGIVKFDGNKVRFIDLCRRGYESCYKVQGTGLLPTDGYCTISKEQFSCTYKISCGIDRFILILKPSMDEAVYGLWSINTPWSLGANEWGHMWKITSNSDIQTLTIENLLKLIGEETCK